MVREMQAGPIRVLLVEDNPGDARLIHEMLREAKTGGFAVEWVSRLSDGLERLGKAEIDLVLLDLGLPDSTGLETFFQAYAQSPGLPFVLLTDLDEETLALSALRHGAKDYLIKRTTDADALLRAIRYAFERHSIETAIEAERKKLFDVLSTLPALVYLTGTDFIISFANRGFMETFGEPGNKPCYSILQGRSQPCETCHAQEILKSNAPQKFEWTSAKNNHSYEIYQYPFSADESQLVLSLAVDITEHKRTEEQLVKKTHDLGERVKELHCLNSITRLMRVPNTSLDKILQNVLELIPPAWQHPDITCARITLEGRTFRSANFRETPWKQDNDILVRGDRLGRVEVFYLREKPTLDEGPFLKEERNLLQTIAKALGVIIERKQTEKEISRLASFAQLNPNPILEIDASCAITFCNPAAIEALENLGSTDLGDFLPKDLQEIQSAAREKGKRVFYREVKIKDMVFGEHIHFAEPFNVLRIYARDITERKQAEQNLRESEQNLHYLAAQLLTTQERERKRISRELHDELGQSLLVLKLQASHIRKMLNQEQNDLKEQCLEMMENCDQLVNEVRRLARDLTPTMVEDFGLLWALQHLIEKFCQHYGTYADVDHMEGLDELFSRETQIVIYRIFQESLTNIGKYAHASRLTIAIRPEDGQISFLVADNGRGFNLKEAYDHDSAHRGLGLMAMEERVRMMGGTLEIQSQEGVGTRISFKIPVT